MEKKMYWDFANGIKRALRNEVNGYVDFEMYAEANIVIFKINFKDFAFKYAVADMSDVCLNGSSSTVVSDILKTYRNSVMNAFFKTDARKARDHKKAFSYVGGDYVD